MAVSINYSPVYVCSSHSAMFVSKLVKGDSFTHALLYLPHRHSSCEAPPNFGTSLWVMSSSTYDVFLGLEEVNHIWKISSPYLVYRLTLLVTDNEIICGGPIGMGLVIVNVIHKQGISKVTTRTSLLHFCGISTY